MASIDGLAERAREACEAALRILWDQAARDGSADFDGVENLDALRAMLTRGKDPTTSLPVWCRESLVEPWRDRFTADELRILSAVAGMDDALRFKA